MYILCWFWFGLLCLMPLSTIFQLYHGGHSAISWWSFSYIVAVSFIAGGNQSTRRKPVASHWQFLSHKCSIEYTSWTGFELVTLVVMGADYAGRCKSNYHTIATTTAPNIVVESFLKFVFETTSFFFLQNVLHFHS